MTQASVSRAPISRLASADDIVVTVQQMAAPNPATTAMVVPPSDIP